MNITVNECRDWKSSEAVEMMYRKVRTLANDVALAEVNLAYAKAEAWLTVCQRGSAPAEVMEALAHAEAEANALRGYLVKFRNELTQEVIAANK